MRLPMILQKRDKIGLSAEGKETLAPLLFTCKYTQPW